MEENISLVISVELSQGKEFKESVENCMEFLKEMQKEYSCNCTLNVSIEQD